MPIDTFEKQKNYLNMICFDGINNINVGDALSIWLTNTDRKISTFKYLKRLVSVSLFRSFNYSISEKNKNSRVPLFFFSHEYASRKEHLLYFQKIVSFFTDSCSCIGMEKKRIIYVKNLLYYPFLLNWIRIIKKMPYDRFFKLLLLVNLIYIYNWNKYIIDNIEFSKFSVLVTLFDAGITDNVLVQQFKHHNIPTITLQHGHFNHTIKKEGYNEIEIAFEGFVSDYMFVWGEYTKQEAMKNGIDAERIRVLGNPKYIGNEREASKNNVRFNNLGVILDGGGLKYYKSNKKMLEIAFAVASEFNYKVVVKPHPASDITSLLPFINDSLLERVCPKSESVLEYANSVDFSLAMGSSVYSELLYLKSLVFRFVHPNYIDRFEGLDWGVFSNKEELVLFINMIEIDLEKVLLNNKKVADMLCVSGDIAKNYIEAFNEIMDSV